MENTDFIAAANRFGLSPTPTHISQLERYLALLLIWNEQLNLTAIREPEEIWVRHFLDALSCHLVTGNLSGLRLVDVGTGAGFPGIPLKIVFPDMHLTLVESVAKKTHFLRTVIEDLHLLGVTILTERAEVLGQQAEHREQYDWVVARAVASLPILLEYLLPLCRVNGYVLAQKGENVQAELEASRSALVVLGGEIQDRQEVWLPARPQAHSLVTIHKTRPTPSAYPRRPGIPSKRPLSNLPQ